jgi:hypothetical protein
LQISDELSENLAPRHSGKPTSLEAQKPFPTGTRVFAVVSAWLVPGAGHFALGRWGRGLLFLVLIGGSFLFGLSLHGRLYAPVPDPTTLFHFDLISVLWSFAQVGTGLLYILGHLLGFGSAYRPGAPTYEYGNTFMFLAGLLNYLVIHDAFDIAAGRKR